MYCILITRLATRPVPVLGVHLGNIPNFVNPAPSKTAKNGKLYVYMQEITLLLIEEIPCNSGRRGNVIWILALASGK